LGAGQNCEVIRTQELPTFIMGYAVAAHLSPDTWTILVDITVEGTTMDSEEQMSLLNKDSEINAMNSPEKKMEDVLFCDNPRSPTPVCKQWKP
jgi:hypothetical protein